MKQHEANLASPLEKLRDTDLEIADWGQDIRGCRVIDAAGEIIGHVSALFVDTGDRKVRMLELSTGGFLGIGDRHALLPVEAVVSVHGDAVHVNESRDRIVHSPVYDPKLTVASYGSIWEPYYGYYGVSPYWSRP